ncbi:MAG: hypothetical protein J6331_08710 [Lentisphaeria bacterium]|nr:hypothetical protein [Lentisphaeria bacterium]
MRNPLPYTGVDWKNFYRISTTNHTHIADEEDFSIAMARGYDLLTISNYYPSRPYYPLSSVRKNAFLRFQEHGVLRNGRFVEGPLDWNEIIREWEDELGEEERKNFPFQEGGPLFPPLPEGMLEAPNAEHHSFVDCDLIMPRGFHVTSPGSLWQSGHFDAGNKYRLKDHGYRIGAGMTWKEGFERILDSLLWEEGGGIVLNHPNYTRAPLDFLLEALDFDDRVLGIEVWNSSMPSEEVWDSILRTGRQCFGFFAPDHYNKYSCLYNPMNILLAKERTARNGMRAYRTGSFFGCLFHSGLSFEEIRFEDDVLYVRTNKDAFIRIIGAPGIIAHHRGKELAFPVTEKKEKLLFLRVKAADETMESIFSQPMFLP